MTIAAAHKYKRWALVHCRRPGQGLPVLIQGGPLDGVEETIPLSAEGVMACQTWPHGDDGEFDYFYALPPPAWRRRAGGRVIYRFSGRRVRA
jgi:hypothetical protein